MVEKDCDTCPQRSLLTNRQFQGSVRTNLPRDIWQFIKDSCWINKILDCEISCLLSTRRNKQVQKVYNIVQHHSYVWMRIKDIPCVYSPIFCMRRECLLPRLLMTTVPGSSSWPFLQQTSVYSPSHAQIWQYTLSLSLVLTDIQPDNMNMRTKPSLWLNESSAWGEKGFR